MTTTNGNDNLDRLPRISSVPSADAPVAFLHQYNTAFVAMNNLLNYRYDTFYRAAIPLANLVGKLPMIKIILGYLAFIALSVANCQLITRRPSDGYLRLYRLDQNPGKYVLCWSDEFPDHGKTSSVVMGDTFAFRTSGGMCNVTMSNATIMQTTLGGPAENRVGQIKYGTDAWKGSFTKNSKLVFNGSVAELSKAGAGAFSKTGDRTYEGGEALRQSKKSGLDSTNDSGSSSVEKGASRIDIASNPDLAADYVSVHNGEKAKASFSGGDGSSIKAAVVITARNEQAGDRAAYIWLHQHYPGSHFVSEGLDYIDDRFYTEIKIVTADGKLRTIYFETTAFFGQ